MKGHESGVQVVAKAAGSFLGHIVLLVLGLALMFGGIGMGVTLVMLPVGILVGFAGLFVFLWGLSGLAGGREEAAGS
jgi:hypothetical protein